MIRNRCQLLICVSFAAATSLAVAEDTVVVSIGPDRTRRLVGEIVELTGSKLVFRHASGRKETFGAERVVSWESPPSPQLEQAEKQFAERRYEQALTAYRPALAAAQRPWVKQRIRGRVVWCYRYLDRIAQAGAAFRVLYGRDPTTREFAAIPLAWMTRAPSARMERLAAQWLEEGDSAVARLLAASWLVTSSARTQSLRTLNSLLSDPDPRIAFLAEAQLWRTRLASVDVDELERWTNRLEAMPSSIRAGPIFVVASALSQRRRHQAAALQFMRIPILYSEHRRLASRSLLAAAAELEGLGQIAEPRTLYREVMVEFPEADEAQQARRHIERLDKSRPESGPTGASESTNGAP